MNLKKVRSHHFLSVVYLQFSPTLTALTSAVVAVVVVIFHFLTEQNGPHWFFCNGSPNQITLLNGKPINKSWKIKANVLARCKWPFFDFSFSFPWLGYSNSVWFENEVTRGLPDTSAMTNVLPPIPHLGAGGCRNCICLILCLLFITPSHARNSWLQRILAHQEKSVDYGLMTLSPSQINNKTAGNKNWFFSGKASSLQKGGCW